MTIAGAALAPTQAMSAEPRLWCLGCGEYGVLDLVLNVVVFVPLGAALSLAGLAPGRSVALCAALSLGIELLQYRVISGRDANLGDLLANTAGGALGVALATARAALLRPTTGAARALLAGASCLWLGALATTAILAVPSRSSGPFTGQYVPNHGAPGEFSGELIDATLGGERIPYRTIPFESPVARRFRERSLALTSRLIPGSPTSREIPLVGIGAPGKGKVIGFAQDGSALVFRLRLRAQDAGFRSPTYRLDDAFPAGAANRAPSILALTGALTGHRVVLRVEGEGRARNLEIPLTVGLGWSMLMPVELSLGRSTLVLNALWLALLTLPLGYYAPRISAGATSWPGWGALLLALVVGLAALPAALGAHATTPSEWTGALAGALAGALLGATLGRRRRTEPPA